MLLITNNEHRDQLSHSIFKLLSYHYKCANVCTYVYVKPPSVKGLGALQSAFCIGASYTHTYTHFSLLFY